MAKYTDYSTLPSRYVEEIAYQRSVEEARKAYGFPASLPESASLSAAMAELSANYASQSTIVGADPSYTEAVNTAAIQAAIDAAGAAGGGTVRLRAGSYTVTELSLKSWSNVLIEGDGGVINYDGTNLPVSRFNVTSGVFGVRFPQTSHYCGLKNIALISNGVLSETPPHAVTTPGVEYGVVVETGSTLMEGVVVIGFQHGCVGTTGLNSNIFDRCTFVFNTKTGFGLTSGNSYSFCHPNLVGPASKPKSTIFTMRDCVIRRNGWGMIIRDGIGTYLNVLSESNFFGGLIFYHGSSDDPVAGTSYKCYFENNFSNYDKDAAYTVTQNSLLLDSAGVSMTWTTNTNTALNDAGYQIYFMSMASGTTAGPGYIEFYQPDLNLPDVSAAAVTAGKGVYLKSSYLAKFYSGKCVAGDQTNAVRFGDGAPYSSNATHFWDWNGTLPALLGNKGVRFDSERSVGNGGMTASQGHFRGLAGNVWFPAAQSASADVNTLDDYEEGIWTGTLTPMTSGTITQGASRTFKYTKIGRQVTVVGHINVDSVSSPVGQLRLTGLPFVNSNSDSNSSRAAVAVYAINLAAGATTSIIGWIDNNADYIILEKYAAGAGSNLAGDVVASTLFTIQATYFV